MTRKYDLSSVRYCLVAAAPLSAELTAQILEVLPDIHLGQGYGKSSRDVQPVSGADITST